MLPADAFSALSNAAANVGPESSVTLLRHAVLLGACHPRVGASSPLRLLPLPILGVILDLALPMEACQLSWKLQQWMPLGEDDSSSSSSSSNSSTSGDDSETGDDSSEDNTTCSSSSSDAIKNNEDGGGAAGQYRHGTVSSAQGRGGFMGRGQRSAWEGSRGFG